MEQTRIPQLPEDYLYAKLEALAQAEGLPETRRALPYMRSQHAGQVRKPTLTGQRTPYLIHPLAMACQAHAMGIREDAVLAAALLHDVCEDCDTPPEQLPCSAPVQHIVALLTKDPKRFQEASQARALAEYYRGIEGNPAAMLVKCLDRCNNLSTMASSFSAEKMEQYIAETERYILPLLDRLNSCRPAWADAVFLLRYQMLGLLETTKAFLLQNP